MSRFKQAGARAALEKLGSGWLADLGVSALHGLGSAALPNDYHARLGEIRKATSPKTTLRPDGVLNIDLDVEGPYRRRAMARQLMGEGRFQAGAGLHAGGLVADALTASGGHSILSPALSIAGRMGANALASKFAPSLLTKSWGRGLTDTLGTFAARRAVSLASPDAPQEKKSYDLSGAEKRAYGWGDFGSDALSSALAGGSAALTSKSIQHGDRRDLMDHRVQHIVPGGSLSVRGDDGRITQYQDLDAGLAQRLQGHFRAQGEDHARRSENYGLGAAATGLAGVGFDAMSPVHGHGVLTPVFSTLGSMGAQHLLGRYAPKSGPAAFAGAAALGNMAGRLGVRGYDALLNKALPMPDVHRSADVEGK